MTDNRPAGVSMIKDECSNRIDFIDGFRGVAILLVLGYHYFSRWANDSANLYPYGDALAGLTPFKFGFYGVPLFFAVSGFVIALTLTRTQGLLEFAMRRFARLWPAMLLCSAISFTVLSMWPDFWPQSLKNFIPTLTFLDARIVWEKLWPGLDAKWVDGAYWSLFVEVRFYLYAGLVYFLSPRNFSRNFMGFAVAVVTLYCVLRMSGHTHMSGVVDDLLIAPFLPWFTGGMAAYDWSQGRRRSGLWLAATSGACMTWLWMADAPNASILVALVVATLFTGCFAVEAVRRLFSAKWLSGIGLSSYSLYLLHQNIGITLIAKVSIWTGWTGPTSVVIALAMMLLMICVSHWIYRYWEQPCNRIVVRWYQQTKAKRSSRLAGVATQ